jgi:hypothetical protein
MGLKGHRLWAMGQLDSNVQRPTAAQRGARQQLARHRVQQRRRVVRPRAVALQVAFERQTLKPVFHLIGYRLWV